MSIRVRCTDCGEEWEDSFGGTFVCPGCEAETTQRAEMGAAYFDGPLKLIRETQ